MGQNGQYKDDDTCCGSLSLYGDFLCGKREEGWAEESKQHQARGPTSVMQLPTLSRQLDSKRRKKCKNKPDPSSGLSFRNVAQTLKLKVNTDMAQWHTAQCTLYNYMDRMHGSILITLCTTPNL